MMMMLDKINFVGDDIIRLDEATSGLAATFWYQKVVSKGYITLSNFTKPGKCRDRLSVDFCIDSNMTKNLNLFGQSIDTIKEFVP